MKRKPSAKSAPEPPEDASPFAVDLTPSEIESLRQDQLEAHEHAKAFLAKVDWSKPPGQRY